MDTILAFEPRSSRVLAQVTVLVRASGRSGWRTGDRIGEYVWGPSGAVRSTTARP